MGDDGAINYHIGGSTTELQKAFELLGLEMHKINHVFSLIGSHSEGALGLVMKWAGVGAAIGGGFEAFTLLKDSIAAAATAQTGGMQWESLLGKDGAKSVLADL